MKRFILSFLIIFSVIVTGCSTPQDPIVSESIKAEFKERGMIVLNVDEFVSKDGTITAKLPVGYLKIHNTNLDKENLMLLNMDTKQSIVLSFVPTSSSQAIKYNENDIFIKNKLHEFYTKYPDMKTEFTAKKFPENGFGYQCLPIAMAIVR